jgi:hypothetical protein
MPVVKRGYLSEYFVRVAAKRLSAVEAQPERSNQHEFNGTKALRTLLGEQDGRWKASLIWVTDEEDQIASAEAEVTWYDSRANQPNRSAEYRLYFPTTAVSEAASEGDLLVVARQRDESLFIAIAKRGSTVENQVRWLFGLTEPGPDFEGAKIEDSTDLELGISAIQVLEYLGIEVEKHDNNYLEEMLHRFDGDFPKTVEFSTYARSTLPAIQATSLPDDAVIAWMDREELLFRTLERHLVSSKLADGFGDVDEFISYSLSVQNRRKSRAGRALENHLEYIFKEKGIRYSRGEVTENMSRPDFLFPSVSAYHDNDFPTRLLSVLGVKSTCKDRWRQVLAEAHRIAEKHLLTLEPGISENQTEEMRANSLTLVVPAPLHDTYSASQRQRLMSVSSFATFVLEKQLT